MNKAKQAEAIYQVVNAMMNGYCPNCGYLGSAHEFYDRGGLNPGLSVYDESNVCREPGYHCTNCDFSIMVNEAEAALAEFLPYLNKHLDIFIQWREEKGCSDN